MSPSEDLRDDRFLKKIEYVEKELKCSLLALTSLGEHLDKELAARYFFESQGTGLLVQELGADNIDAKRLLEGRNQVTICKKDIGNDYADVLLTKEHHSSPNSQLGSAALEAPDHEMDEKILDKAHCRYLNMFKSSSPLSKELGLVENFTNHTSARISSILDRFVPVEVREACDMSSRTLPWNLDKESLRNLSKLWCGGRHSSTPFAGYIRHEIEDKMIARGLKTMLDKCEEDLKSLLHQTINHQSQEVICWRIGEVSKCSSVCFEILREHRTEAVSLQELISMSRGFKLYWEIMLDGRDDPTTGLAPQGNGGFSCTLMSLRKGHHYNLHPKYKIARWKGF